MQTERKKQVKDEASVFCPATWKGSAAIDKDDEFRGKEKVEGMNLNIISI